MDKKKTLIGISTTAIMLLLLLAPMLITQPVLGWIDPTGWYMTIDGVLATDTYVLYPYAARNLRIGFSQFGEMIDSITNVGLEYDGAVDPFAFPAGPDVGPIIKARWINGWLINITYLSTADQRDRNVWACALFADTRDYGGPWLRVDFPNDYDATYGWEDPRDPGYVIGAVPYPGTARYGGRKTNGTAVTEPIQVLYNGPRRFVALLNTTIYDHPLHLDDSREADIPLVRLLFTIIFDKVKKQVIILKDVKSLLEAKYGSDLRIQFSNRGEVDLGTRTYLSNAYFWTQDTQTGWDPNADGWLTAYDASWELSQTDLLPGGVTLSAGYPQRDVPATFDVAMAINPADPYVWWAAFWPSLSDYTIDGWSMWWRSMMSDDPHDTSITVAEERTPFYIGEWDFRLDIVDAPTPVEGVQFRFVTVYGVTDRNDGALIDANEDGDFDDYPAPDTCTPDREMVYQLNEVFWPWDLYDAVHKRTERHVEFRTADSGGAITLSYAPFWLVPTTLWDQYSVFSERVIDLSVTPPRVLNRWLGDYSINIGPGGVATITGLTPGHLYKILYSTFNVEEKIFKIHIEDEILEYSLPHIATSIEGVLNVTDPENPEWLAEELYRPINGTHPILGEVIVGIKFDNSTGVFYPCQWYKVIYCAIVGRYEWIVVGRDSAAVDSAGAAMVSEAFDSKKNIVVLKSGLDMQDTVWGPNVPYMMRMFRPGAGTVEVRPGVFQPSRSCYRDAVFKSCSGRSALLDDWCERIPVASSNIITIGSPWANHLTEYFNEFTDAYLDVGYGEDGSQIGAFPGYIVSLSCWSKYVYKPDDPNGDGNYDDQTVGYAVISTYKDLNGTVGLVIWGWTGQDTFYACEWFWDEGIEQLQWFPPCVTTIILEIDYTEHPPEVRVVECLGTISETLVHEVKGGIHPDP